MKKIFFTIILTLTATFAKADLIFDTSLFYNSNNQNGVDYVQKEGHLFIGIPIAVKDQLYLGINFITNDDQTSTGGIGTTEIGPRINYYINQDKTFHVNLAYHPYVKYTEGDFDASSYLVGVGYQMKVNTNFFIGTSIVYHSTTKTDKTNKTESTVTTTRPMISFSFRFR